MAVLVWEHGTTAEAARAAIQAALATLGHGDQVTWAGHQLTASVGLGLVLAAAGRVTDDAVVIDRCGGMAGGAVLAKCRELLARLFPGGEPAG